MMFVHPTGEGGHQVRTAGCLCHLYTLRGISNDEFYPEDLRSLKWRQAAPSRSRNNRESSLNFTSRAICKAGFLSQTFSLESQRSPEQWAPRCWETPLFFANKDVSQNSLSLDSHLRIFSSCFATYKTSSLSESRSCIAFPPGRALGLPLQQES